MADSPAPSFRAFLERVPPAQFTDPATALPPARGDEDSGDEDNDNSEVAADDPPTPSSSLYSEGVWPHFDATLTEPEPDPVSPPTLPRPVSLDAIEREIRRLLILQQTTSLRIEAGRSLPLTLGTSTPDLLAPRPEEGDGQEPDTPARTPASLSRARTRKKAMHTLGLRRGGNSGDIHMRGLPYHGDDDKIDAVGGEDESALGDISEDELSLFLGDEYHEALLQQKDQSPHEAAAAPHDAGADAGRRSSAPLTGLVSKLSGGLTPRIKDGVLEVRKMGHKAGSVVSQNLNDSVPRIRSLSRRAVHSTRHITAGLGRRRGSSNSSTGLVISQPFAVQSSSNYSVGDMIQQAAHAKASNAASTAASTTRLSPDAYQQSMGVKSPTTAPARAFDPDRRPGPPARVLLYPRPPYTPDSPYHVSPKTPPSDLHLPRQHYPQYQHQHQYPSHRPSGSDGAAGGSNASSMEYVKLPAPPPIPQPPPGGLSSFSMSLPLPPPPPPPVPARPRYVHGLAPSFDALAAEYHALEQVRRASQERQSSSSSSRSQYETGSYQHLPRPFPSSDDDDGGRGASKPRPPLPAWI